MIAARRGWRWLALGAATTLAGSAAAQLPDWSVQARQRLLGGPGAASTEAPAERRRLVDQGQACLAAGDVDCARRAFEQAASIAHAADIEIGIVRTQMQAGEYRQALAFAAHTAGAHRDVAAGRALYAQLLRQGGQAAAAQRLLDAAGSDEAPAPPFRPPALGEAVPERARLVGGAVLLPGGALAIAPQALLADAASLWLRDGLGRAVRGELVRSDTGSGLALLRLARPLGPAALALAPRDPFPGSPGYLVGFAPSPRAAASWPQLKLGFLGRFVPGGSERWLGIDPVDAGAGAAVFDAAGRLAGISLPAGADGRPRLAGVAALQALAGIEADAAAAPAAGHPTVDAIYEQGLRSALQLLAGP